MGKGILNRGTKVHQSKTKEFKWEDELHDDEEKFKFTPNQMTMFSQIWKLENH